MTGHIFIYGGIGTGLGEVSLKSVKAQIDPAASEYVVHIVSPGGEVFEGFGIYNILKNTGKKITTHIEGVCASIATLIAFAGDRIVMNKTSEFMIHNPKISDTGGESKDLRNVASQLDTIKNLLVDVSGARAQRNGKPISKEELWKLYDNETWLSAESAHTFGFVDEVQDAIKAVARVDFKKINMEKSLFQRLVQTFQNKLTRAKIKNEFTETLEDGTIVIVLSEDGAWEGKQIVREDGAPLEPGDYTLASGKIVTVGDNSTISAVKEAASPAAQQDETEMNRIAELEKQLAEANAALQAAQANTEAAQKDAATARTEASKFQNRLTGIEKEFLTLKEEMTKTIGNTESPAAAGAAFKNAAGEGQNEDPMGDYALSFFKTRNLIQN